MSRYKEIPTDLLFCCFCPPVLLQEVAFFHRKAETEGHSHLQQGSAKASWLLHHKPHASQPVFVSCSDDVIACIATKSVIYFHYCRIFFTFDVKVDFVQYIAPKNRNVNKMFKLLELANFEVSRKVRVLNLA